MRPCDASMLSTTTTSPVCSRIATEAFHMAERMTAIVAGGISSPSAKAVCIGEPSEVSTCAASS